MILNSFRVHKLFTSVKFCIAFTLIVLICLWELSKLNDVLHKKIGSVFNMYDNETLLTKNSEHNMSRLSIGVYYEALCPDSRHFILQQLIPSFYKAPDSFDIEFIPYGKAKTNENIFGFINFECQHGPRECHANKIHSCAIHHIKVKSVLIKYIECMIFNNYEPETIGVGCAQIYNINWSKIFECSKGNEGDQLLKLNGEATNNLWPKLSNVPTITMNNKQLRRIPENFWNFLCFYFPPESVPDGC